MSPFSLAHSSTVIQNPLMLIAVPYMGIIMEIILSTILFSIKTSFGQDRKLNGVIS